VGAAGDGRACVRLFGGITSGVRRCREGETVVAGGAGRESQWSQEVQGGRDGGRVV
jgi:hypothetical protein